MTVIINRKACHLVALVAAIANIRKIEMVRSPRVLERPSRRARTFFARKKVAHDATRAPAPSQGIIININVAFPACVSAESADAAYRPAAALLFSFSLPLPSLPSCPGESIKAYNTRETTTVHLPSFLPSFLSFSSSSSFPLETRHLRSVRASFLRASPPPREQGGKCASRAHYAGRVHVRPALNCRVTRGHAISRKPPLYSTYFLFAGPARLVKTKIGALIALDKFIASELGVT